MSLYFSLSERHARHAGEAPHPVLSDAQRLMLLKRAAALLASHVKCGAQSFFRPHLFGRTTRFRVTWRWPGVLCAYDAETGELCAESVIGRPSTVRLRRSGELKTPLDEQVALMRAAAALVESDTRTGVTLTFRPRLFGLDRSYRATWVFPGVVSVLDIETGELLSRSEPGRGQGSSHSLEYTGADPPASE